MTTINTAAKTATPATTATTAAKTTATTAEPTGGATLAQNAPATPADSATTAEQKATSVELPASSSDVKLNAQGRSFSTIGDPHETSGDGHHFDNQLEGKFVKLRSESGDFELQTQHTKPSADSPITVNTAAAAKLGNDVVNYDANTRKLTVNGQEQALTDGQEVKLPDGGSLVKNGDTIAMTSPKGDKVNVQDKGGYLDVTGEVGPDRKSGEVKGSLGTMDADTDGTNDLVGRDGKVYDDAHVQDFEKDWQVKDGESLFDGERKAAEPTAGAGPEAANADDTMKQIEDTLKSFSPEELKGLLGFLQTLKGLMGGSQAADQAPAADAAAQPTGGAGDAAPADGANNAQAADANAQPAAAEAQDGKDGKDGADGKDAMGIFDFLFKILQMFTQFAQGGGMANLFQANKEDEKKEEEKKEEEKKDAA